MRRRQRPSGKPKSKARTRRGQRRATSSSSTPHPRPLGEGWEFSIVQLLILLTSPRTVLIAVTSVLLVVGMAAPRAQGRPGRPATPPGHAKKTTTVQTTATPSLPETSRRLETFGSWLDTADVNAPGEAWMWVSTAYWQSQALRQIDAPAMGLSVGIAPRAQVVVSVPYYFLTDRFGSTSHGFGASYVTTKLAVTRNHRVNVSTSPTLEILNWTSATVGRVNWLLPVSAQTYAGRVRVYGSTGYVSRGSVFGSGAFEWSARDNLTFTTTAAHSYSVVSDPPSDALGIPRHRTDASAGVYVVLRPTILLFANVGRTFAPVNDTSGRLAVSGGVTMNVARRGTNVPRTQ
jgi:hypothetical protein